LLRHLAGVKRRCVACIDIQAGADGVEVVEAILDCLQHRKQQQLLERLLPPPYVEDVEPPWLAKIWQHFSR
jgi:hypothetical protein